MGKKGERRREGENGAEVGNPQSISRSPLLKPFLPFSSSSSLPSAQREGQKGRKRRDVFHRSVEGKREGGVRGGVEATGAESVIHPRTWLQLCGWGTSPQSLALKFGLRSRRPTDHPRSLYPSPTSGQGHTLNRRRGICT